MLLAGGSAMHRQGSPEPQLPPSGIPMQNLDDRFQQMARVFGIASSDTKARPHPPIDCGSRQGLN